MNKKVTLEMLNYVLNEAGELWRDVALWQTSEVHFVAP